MSRGQWWRAVVVAELAAVGGILCLWYGGVHIPHRTWLVHAAIVAGALAGWGLAAGLCRLAPRPDGEGRWWRLPATGLLAAALAILALWTARWSRPWLSRPCLTAMALRPALGPDGSDLCDPDTAEETLIALGADSVPALVVLLEDEDAPEPPKIRALRVIREIGPPAAAATPVLMDLLTSGPGPPLDERALQSLSAIGRPAVPFLAELLLEPAPPLRPRLLAIQALAGMGPEASSAVPVLVEVLDLVGCEPETRATAAYALGEIGLASPEAVAGLAQAVADPGGEPNVVRPVAARSLGWMGPTAAPAIPALIEALEPRDVLDRTGPEAGWALGRIGPAAVPALVNALEDDQRSAYSRQLAARALGRIGPVAGAARPSLQRLAERPPDDALGNEARQALERIEALR